MSTPLLTVKEVDYLVRAEAFLWTISVLLSYFLGSTPPGSYTRVAVLFALSVCAAVLGQIVVNKLGDAAKGRAIGAPRP